MNNNFVGFFFKKDKIKPWSSILKAHIKNAIILRHLKKHKDRARLEWIPMQRWATAKKAFLPGEVTTSLAVVNDIVDP